MKLFYAFISSVLRRFNKKLPYFLCCASCGEIEKELQGRFCTSLSFSAPISLLLSTPEIIKVEKDIFLLNKNCSWLHNIIIITEKNSLLSSMHLSSRIPIEFLTIKKDDSDIFLYAQEITSLCEHFIVCSDVSFFSCVRDPLDFFTPNGIPLCKLYKSTTEMGAFEDFNPYKKNIALTKKSIKSLMENNYHNLESINTEFNKVLYSLFLHGAILPVYYDV